MYQYRSIEYKWFCGCVHRKFRQTFTLGDSAQNESKLPLSELQKLGMEVPPQIYCFVQSMNRLQNTIDEMNNTIMLGKLLVDTVQNGDISGNKEPPVRDELDVMGKFTDYFRSAEGRKIVHVDEHYFDDDADLADKDKAHIKNFFLENGMPQYLIELNAKYLNRSDYNPGGQYFEKVLNRINTAHD